MEKKPNKIEVQNQETLKKILICLYILVALVSLNIVFTISNRDSSIDKSTESKYDISQFKVITANNLSNELNITERAVLLIGKPDCVYTEQFIPVLKQAQEKYGYKTLYLDLTTLTDEDKNTLLGYDDSTKVLEQNYGSTPMVIAFKDKKMADVWIGYESLEQFSSFLEKAGFDKK